MVIHLAALAHRVGKTECLSLQDYRQANVEATLSLARQALAAGVKRFVFLSSIGVNGATSDEGAFNEDAPCRPHSDYALSKHEAEEGLKALAKNSGMELVIIRPPLVYAHHAPANFHRLLSLVSRRLPLPFASVTNRRSMIALENLVDFISLCVSHPKAANELFLISDNEDVSISQIIRHLSKGMGIKPRLFPMPVKLLKFGASVLKKESLYTQLCASLLIDPVKAKEKLGWSPRIHTVDGLEKAGAEFLKR